MDAWIVTIFKNWNYRGISRLSTLGKVLACVLANCVLPLSEEILPESQHSIRSSRGTADMIFTIIIKKTIKKHTTGKGSHYRLLS